MITKATMPLGRGISRSDSPRSSLWVSSRRTAAVVIGVVMAVSAGIARGSSSSSSSESAALPANTRTSAKNAAGGGVVSLTMGAFNSLSTSSDGATTTNRTVFVKFYAPWCGHCQSLAPVWESFAADWRDGRGGSRDSGRPSSELLVGELDCTVDRATERWCQDEMNIEGFPTLLYGDPSMGGVFLQEYGGDRSHEALLDFATDELSKPFCTPGNLQACGVENSERATMQSYLDMSLSALTKSIEEREKAIDDAEEKFKAEFDRMQAEYDRFSQDHELTVAKIKANLKMLRSVQSSQL